jgi:methyl-accepting chemotaxis protein
MKSYWMRGYGRFASPVKVVAWARWGTGFSEAAGAVFAQMRERGIFKESESAARPSAEPPWGGWMTSNSLRDRLSFMKLDAQSQALIRKARPALMEALPAALDEVYDQVQASPDARRHFTGASQIQAAKTRQAAHWERIASAEFDEAYVQSVTAIGEIHARSGLEPRWCVGGNAIMLERLIAAVLKQAWPKQRFGGSSAAAAAAAAQIGAITKATFLDVDYAVSVCFEAIAASNKQAIADALAAERKAVAATVGAGLEALARGELTYHMADDLPAEYAKLGEDFNAAAGFLARTMSQLHAGAEGITRGTDEIAQAADDLSRRTEQQAASLEETAAALDEITATVQRTAVGAREASETVGKARTEAVRSGEIVADAIQAMSDIEVSSREIGNIIGVIDEIAFQTNLLALNAGVEAARAGDAGKGFAVVASEVRALAQRSADAAKQIKSLISSSSEQVAKGVDLVGRTGRTLDQIVTQVSSMDALVSEIAASAQEQSAGLAEVNSAINQMDQVVQQNAAMVQQSTAATHTLKNESTQLAELVSRFDTGQEAGSPQQRPQRTPAAARSPARALTARVARSFGATALKSTDGWDEF